MHHLFSRNYSTSTIVFRALVLILILVLGGWIVSDKFLATPYTILVDGKAVVTVESLRAAKNVLEKARLERGEGAPSGSVRIIQSVTLRRAANGVDISDIPEAVRSVENVTTVEGYLYAIDADGEPLVAFVDQRDAYDTIRLLKEHYESKLPDRQGDSTFKERVFVEKRHVSLSKLKDSPQDALDYLAGDSEPPVVYMMKSGDRVVRLAQKFRVSMDELKRLNAEKNLNYLIEGDTLTIQPAKRPITVVSKAVISRTEDVKPPAVGRSRRHAVQGAGKRQAEVLVIYENGEQVREEVISQVTTWDRPKTSVTGANEDDRGSARQSRRHKSNKRSHSANWELRF